ncbi:hypothetical protein I5M27_10870 [Adhaeribacter sp. BT258]|uniref:YD repeat-containing protein n=1 Tax=Adhaeribacter terrigena TaxID=2793070 RepID=A0ABS1C266_9BACT|nr:hypothetical protein [Adhaeribacter terrigena]MBK0403489.1 hypothetical protein [Adhaeribacter terrigena]
MNKIYGIISTVLGCMLFLLVSCSDKNKDPNVNPQPKNYRPAGSAMYDPATNEVGDSTLHYYDSNGKLVQLVRSDGISAGPPVNLAYDNLGRISEIMFPPGRVIQKRDYNGLAQLQKIHQYTDLNDANFKTSEQTFVYDIAGKLTRINSVSFDSRLGISPMHSFNAFTYNAEGLIATDSLFILDNGNAWFESKTEFEYDNKKGVNEFGISLPMNSFADYLYLFAPLKSNIISITKTQRNSIPAKVTYQYQYNADNYPVKITRFSNGGILGTKRISYKYF